MKWFRHDSDANQDAKLKRLRMKYGLEGYGLYWYCLELVASEVDVNKLTFELEHDSEIIAFDTGIHYERVQEMMSYMVDLGLFENSDGTVTCLKLAKRLDQSMTSNPKMRKMIAGIKDGDAPSSSVSHDEPVMGSCKTRLDQRREDKPLVASGDATEGYPDRFEDLWEAYPKRRGSSKKAAHKAWSARIKQGASHDEILEGVRAYATFCEKTGKLGTEFVKLAQTFFGPGEHYAADWSVSDCPHDEIVEAWNASMPAHISKVDTDAWTPGSSGHDRLEDTWERMKVKVRSDGAGYVVQNPEQGARWFRQVFRRLAKSPRLIEETSAQWCRMSWAVKNETIHEIAQGGFDE